eukprot:TRINITY_DN18582_c0_g1_i1.p1 TRINITY_DN18582_c0_g1~~TRINITY_DN18582_c0_g1_i1.p1  ORF type:complete len:406 (+),score=95.51 TRINITY_DN18582_c0_g1_i1:57-1274(+)
MAAAVEAGYAERRVQAAHSEPPQASSTTSARPQPQLPSYLKVVSRLGSGAYGEVFRCQNMQTGQHVAVKWVRKFAEDPLFGKRILREIKILRAMNHENLLRLTDVLPVPNPDFDDVYIEMPFMQTDLHRVIHSAMQLSESQCQAFVCQIMRGLKYLHSAGVVHRDLKPANILVNTDCTLKVADFGLARGRHNEEEELTDYVVTRYYRAPELMLLPGGYFEAVDLWSVGCIIAELMARKALFPGTDTLDMLRRIAATLGFDISLDLVWVPARYIEKITSVVQHLRLPSEPVTPLAQRLPKASQHCIDLVQHLLAKVPSQRISAVEALEHPYIAHLRDPEGEKDAERQFPWDFDGYEPSVQALKEKVYAECARFHPEIVGRDAELLTARGFLGSQAAPRSTRQMHYI